MTGMNSGPDSMNATLVAAFRSALLHQLGLVATIALLLTLAGLATRGRWATATPPAPAAEPRAWRLTRVGFGVLWLIDGILQAQPGMAGGLPAQVIEPAAAASAGWVQHVVAFGGTLWSYHPVQAAAAAVWIQVGLGLWLIAAPAGWSSRLAGLSGAVWGLIIWVFGESFGGLFAPGLSWLSGAPGAVILYVAAGVLTALPARAWAGPRLGRLVMAGIGLLWAGLAVLQAWPGRGSWRSGDSGALTGMVSDMAQVSQPPAQAALVSGFASFTSDHGFAVNLVVVIVLGTLAAAFLHGSPRLLRLAVPVATAFCLADWVLVQDLGVPGGFGTDPNSMVPWVVLLWTGLVAITGPSAATAAESPAHAVTAGRPRLRELAVAALRPRQLAALGAVCAVMLGAAPMAVAAVSRDADPVIAQAIAGAPVPLDRLAPDFRLTSGESGRPVSLGSLRGKVVLLTFLDPTCAGCPQIAQELHSANAQLGAAGARVELVAIAASTRHSDVMFLRAFDRQQGLSAVPNWLFLTGTGPALQRVWDAYEEIAPHMMAGMMVHSQVVFVIDGTGRIRWEVRNSPGPPTASAQSSAAGVLAGAASQTVAATGRR